MVIRDAQLVERLAFWAIRERIPMFAQFGLSRGCNLRCRFCFWGEDLTRRGFMSREIFQKALTELSEMGGHEIDLTGGEPTVHPEFPEFVEMASRLMFVMTITTNGFRLTDRTLAAIAEGLVAHVRVSIHGSKPETNDRLVRRQGAWKAAVANIGKLVDAGLHVEICFAVTKENLREFWDARVFFTDMGATFHPVIKIYNPYGLPEVESTKLAKGDLKEVVSHFPEPPTQGHPCGAFMNSLFVTHNGAVWPCITLPVPVGDLQKNTVKEIWAGLDKRSRDLIQSLVGDRAKGTYRGIDYFCPSLSLPHDGSLWGLEPYTRDIIDAWLESRDEDAGSASRDPWPRARQNVPSFPETDIRDCNSPEEPPLAPSPLPEITDNHLFSASPDVAFRLLVGKEESFLLFWKKATREYLALEGPWAEAVDCLIRGGTIPRALRILAKSFDDFDETIAGNDLLALVGQLVSRGILEASAR